MDYGVPRQQISDPCKLTLASNSIAEVKASHKDIVLDWAVAGALLN